MYVTAAYLQISELTKALEAFSRSYGKFTLDLHEMRHFSKSLPAPDEWSTPQLELHALHTLANILAVLRSALGEWIEFVVAFGDSTIVLSWAVYEKVKLHVFHRLRVSNIRSKIDLDELFHVDGKENVADIGTRPDLLTTDMMMPGSDWIRGRPWMTLPIEKAVESGVIQNVKEIKLSNDARKVFKEGVIFDSFEDNIEHKTTIVCVEDTIATIENDIDAEVNKVDQGNTVDKAKVIEREKFADYIYPPLRRSFRPTVRIIGLVLRAAALFKKLLLAAKIKRGEANKSDMLKLNFPPVKFTTFTLITGKNIEEKLDRTDKTSVKLTEFFRVSGVMTGTY